jgi:hypothetical protein
MFAAIGDWLAWLRRFWSARLDALARELNKPEKERRNK